MSFGGFSVPAPKFRLSILGVLKGFDAVTVQNNLIRQLHLTPQQVELLLSNQAAATRKLMAHKDAFQLQSALREAGVDCVIKPVPLEGLAERAETFSLNGSAEPSAVNRAPASRIQRPSPVRTGRSANQPTPSTKGAMSVWPMAALVVLVVLASWLFEAPERGLDAASAPQVASVLDSRAID